MQTASAKNPNHVSNIGHAYNYPIVTTGAQNRTQGLRVSVLMYYESASEDSWYCGHTTHNTYTSTHTHTVRKHPVLVAENKNREKFFTGNLLQPHTSGPSVWCG